MKKIKLSFCISTFNRANFIGETLDSIIPQLTDEIEIVIVDGASTDATEYIIQGYQRKCPHMRYFKQEKNSGIDCDYNNAVERAQGEYCWLMSDDDLLKPGAVSALLGVLSTSEYSLVIVNAEVMTKDLSRVIHKNMLGMSNDKIYRPCDAQGLFVDVAKYLSFIGAVVIKRTLWIERERERYFGSAFIHMGVIFQKPLTGDVFVIAHPWIVIRYGNGFWNPKKFEIWLFKWPQLVWSFSEYSDEVKRKISPQKPWEKIRTLTLFRAVGAFSLNEYRTLLKPRMAFGWRRLAARVVAVIPSPLFNFLWTFYISTIHRCSPMWLYDLKHSSCNYLNCLCNGNHSTSMQKMKKKESRVL